MMPALLTLIPFTSHIEIIQPHRIKIELTSGLEIDRAEEMINFTREDE